MYSVKKIGMVHIEGVNDKEFKIFLNKQPKEKVRIIPVLNQW
jgi:hypothetical protein